MLKKTISYIDYDGNERKEDHYFNLNKAEVIELELEEQGGLSKLVEKLVAEQDGKRIMAIFKDLIMRSYGEKSLDGKRFIKSPELSTAFIQTEAYSELIMEMLTDPNAAAAFVNGIVPKSEENPEDSQPKTPQITPIN